MKFEYLDLTGLGTLVENIKSLVTSVAGKVNHKAAATTKAYITGTTSSADNTDNQIFDPGVYLDTTAGQLVATTFKGNLDGNAATASTATKLGSNDGTATKPVYFSGGKPVACTYELNKTVPSDAKFTDTVYTLPTASSTLGGVKTTSTVTSTSGLTACPIIEGVPYYKDTDTTYTNEELGQGYGTCSTAQATIAKDVTLSNYALVNGGVVSVKFTYAVPASATLNVNSKGAKSIYYKGKAIIDGIIGAGEIATFMYDGSCYHLLNVDRIRFNPTFIPIGTEISASESAPVNLNTIPYLKVGNYFCSQNAKAEYITNLPQNGTAFMMQVYSPLSTAVDNETTGNWVYRIRRLTHYTGEEYIQFCSTTGTAGVWNYGAWDKLIKASDITNQVTKVTFTASDSKWGALANGRYPLTISASGGEFLNCYRTNGSNYDKMDVNVTVSGNNIIIYSLDKFAGYMTYLK